MARQFQHLQAIRLLKDLPGRAASRFIAIVGLNMDFTTKRLVDKIDYQATYMNCMTGAAPEQGRIPPYYKSDRETIETAFRTVGLVKPKDARVVHIANTLRLEEMEISESMMTDAMALSNVTVVGKPRPMAFDRQKNLISDLPTE